MICESILAELALLLARVEVREAVLRFAVFFLKTLKDKRKQNKGKTHCNKRAEMVPVNWGMKKELLT